MKKKYIFMIIIIILLGVISFFYYEKVHTETFLSLPEAKEVVSIKYKIVIITQKFLSNYVENSRKVCYTSGRNS